MPGLLQYFESRVDAKLRDKKYQHKPEFFISAYNDMLRVYQLYQDYPSLSRKRWTKRGTVLRWQVVCQSCVME